MRKTFILAGTVSLLLVGCETCTQSPSLPEPQNDMKPGPGLFSGPKGHFEIPLG